MQTIKWQTRAVYGWLVIGQSIWMQAKFTAYRLYARCLSVTQKVPLHLQYAACGATQVLYYFAFMHALTLIDFTTKVTHRIFNT